MYDVVRLKSAREAPGVPVGSRGTIPLIYDDKPLAYEVEFMDDVGESLGTYTLRETDLELDELLRMSGSLTTNFADLMLSSSSFLRDNCQDLEEFYDPPLPVFLMAYFGKTIAAKYDMIGAEEWMRFSALIEQGLASEDCDIGTAVATGLLEGMIHRAELVERLWPRIERGLGPLAQGYADAYRSADFTKRD